MRTIYEIIVDVLPALRSAIAKELVSVYGMNQAQVAETMAVSQPAVSQYLNSIRGNLNQPWMNNQEFQKILKESCEKLATKKATIVTELPVMVRQMREKEIICGTCELKDNFCEHCANI